jgi:hypothetical protein
VREPSVYILGVQKCGTTTVADVLAAQPEIFVPSIKETYFFCDEEHFAKGTDWYIREFYSPGATADARLYCDATPFYLASPQAMKRIARHIDESARFIVCLRDPVARAYSAYWHQCRLGNEPLSFEAALDAEPVRVAESRAAQGRWWRHAYVEVGHYGSQLERAFELLGRDRFLVLNETDLRDIAGLQSRLRAFLQLPARDDLPSVDRSNSAAMPRSTLLRSLITRRNPLKRVAQILLPRELRSAWGRKLMRLNQKSVEYPPMREETRDTLEAHFTQELAKLESLGISVPTTWRTERT